MERWTARSVALVISGVAVVVGVSACAPVDSPDGAPTSRGAGNATTASLPDLVGRGLQNAQDTAQAAGFDVLTSHDALGRGRHQLLDRDWKVCFQRPAPGSVPTSATVDLGAVKLEESCPATDQSGTEPGPAGATMPNLVGKSVEVAEQSLGRKANISFHDATGADRAVIVASNWQVCAQNPAPGAPYNGVPVTLTVAKFTGSCR